MDKIQSAIQEMNTLGYDQISIRATVLESTCFVYATNALEGSPSTVKFTSSSIENSVIGALMLLKRLVADDLV